MKRKRLLKQLSQFSIFSEKPLILLVSVVTLLLQLISFATTWNGSKIYLEGIFSYASLFFAVAVQATAYFFSNSLRRKINILKLVALCMAMCCSTYYSYIGIYNSVNSPATYLQEQYTTITRSLTRSYDEETEASLSEAQAVVNKASSTIILYYTELMSMQQNLTDCRNALGEIQVSYTEDMRAPSKYSYGEYEDYVAAYEAYIEAVSKGSTTESEALRNQTLSAYGYASVEVLNQTDQELIASQNALQTALGTKEDISATVSALSMELTGAITNVGQGIPFSAENTSSFHKLLQAAALCGYSESASQLINKLNQCAQAKAEPLLRDYAQLVALLPQKAVTDANTMNLKGLMDAEILSALLKLNTLLPTHEQIPLTHASYQITDLYLLPIKALQSPDTKTTALFCFMVALLVDTLSVLFALSLRPRKPLWKRQLLLLCNIEDYETQIFATLPAPLPPVQALEGFLAQFAPSPDTEGDGYMLRANLDNLPRYHALAALLCQVNLAKIVPAGYLDSDASTLLLKARFVFWANHRIYEERKDALYE